MRVRGPIELGTDALTSTLNSLAIGTNGKVGNTEKDKN